jgi:hypothetical protein
MVYEYKKQSIEQLYVLVVLLKFSLYSPGAQ